MVAALAPIMRYVLSRESGPEAVGPQVAHHL